MLNGVQKSGHAWPCRQDMCQDVMLLEEECSAGSTKAGMGLQSSTHKALHIDSSQGFEEAPVQSLVALHPSCSVYHRKYLVRLWD